MQNILQKAKETKRTDEAEREFMKAEKRETARRIEETVYSERDEIEEYDDDSDNDGE